MAVVGKINMCIGIFHVIFLSDPQEGKRLGVDACFVCPLVCLVVCPSVKRNKNNTHLALV